MNSEKESTSFTKKITTNTHGMTLIEILIALTLISLMGTFIAGKVFKQLHEGRVKSARIQMKGFEAQLKEFKRKCGFYPGTEQGLEALLTKPTGGRECKNYPPDGFLDADEIPADPWETEYEYVLNGKRFDIISLGLDGEEGGEEEDTDIHLRKKKK